MIGRAAWMLLAMATPLWGDQHGALPEDGVCFTIHNGAVRFCVPTYEQYRLIEAEYSDGTFWADFEAGFLTLNVSVLPNAQANTAYPTDFSGALDRSRIRHEVDRGIELDAYLLRQCGDIAVFEAFAETEETNEFYVEIVAPEEVMYLSLTDFSPPYDDIQVAFDTVLNAVRDHSACPGAPLFPPLLPIPTDRER